MPGANLPIEHQEPPQHTTHPLPARAWNMASSGTHTVLGGAEMVVTTVSGHGVAEAVHMAQCRTCTASSELAEDDERPAAVWAVQHTRAHPQHRHYLTTTRRRWRVDPRPAEQPASNPLPVDRDRPGPCGADSTQPQDRHRTHHTRPPRTQRLLNAVTDHPGWFWIRWTAAAIRCAWAARILPIAGPLFLASTSAALGFFVGAVFSLGPG